MEFTSLVIALLINLFGFMDLLHSGLLNIKMIKMKAERQWMVRVCKMWHSIEEISKNYLVNQKNVCV